MQKFLTMQKLDLREGVAVKGKAWRLEWMTLQEGRGK